VPKISSPDISTGFWVTVGVLFALFVAGLANMLVQRARAQAG
jgi:hypothetical protein